MYRNYCENIKSCHLGKTVHKFYHILEWPNHRQINFMTDTMKTPSIPGAFVVLMFLSPLIESDSLFEEEYLDSMKKKFDESIRDIFESPYEDESQGRLFNFDQRYAFNSSVAFTMPLITFFLPTDEKPAPTETGTRENTFRALLYTSGMLIIGLLFAIYTNSQGPTDGAMNEAYDRAFGSQGRSFFAGEIMNTISGTLDCLSEALDADSCAKLSICEAHAEPQKYGLLGWPIRYFVPIDTGFDENKITEYERAAIFGYEKRDECYYEFPCLVQPLDAIIYVKDYIKNYLILSHSNT